MNNNNGYTVSIVQDEKSSGDWLSNINVFNTTQLLPEDG